MRVLERKEVVFVAGSDGGGGFAGTFDSGISAPASQSFVTNPTCPPGYAPSITGSQTSNGFGLTGTFTMTGPLPGISIQISSPANSTTTSSGCLPSIPQTGAPEADGGYTPTPYAYGANGP